jgi:glycosyltransferase involved in cell wall biosynthesis
MKLLLLINLRLDERRDALGKGQRPQLGYDALAAAVRALPDGRADILDQNSVDREGGWEIRLARRLFGYHTALALLGYKHCQQYDAVYSDSEFVALPLALLIGPHRARPRHVTSAYYLTGRRNALCHRLLGAHRGMDTIFTLSKEQYETGRKLTIPESKLVFLESCGHVDVRFFSTETGQAVDERQICSTGLEFRDYQTLVRAVAELPFVKLKIDPASPSSLHRTAVDHSRMPPNAEIVHMGLGRARQLYAESAAVVIPLRANPMGAGTWVMVEAMLMGKPVIITRSQDGTFAGRRDLVDGESVIMVDAGDVPGLRNAIERLMTDQELRRRIGARGREWALQHANREEWLKILIDALSGTAEDVTFPEVADAGVSISPQFGSSFHIDELERPLRGGMAEQRRKTHGPG